MTSSKSNISIITPWYGRTEGLIAAYAAATAGAEVIIVDNATPPETAQALRAAAEQHGWTLIRNETNAGFAAGNNQGYAVATGDVIVFLNSDVEAPPQFLAAVAADVRDDYLYGPSLQAQFVAGRWLPYLEGWCVAATVETWQRLDFFEREGPPETPLGPWDADAYPGPYWEDNDLCLRAAQAGVGLVQTAWPIRHLGGRSGGGLDRWAESIEANRTTFAQRAMAARDARPATLTAARARYLQELQTQSDIQHHLPLLHARARGNVVELGTRSGVSTAALLAGVERNSGRVWSVDIDDCSQHFPGHPLWAFVQGDSTDGRTAGLLRDADALPCDVLFIDTLHNYDHVTAELNVWAPHVRPGGVILIHDPETFPGVRRAIDEYCAVVGWRPIYVLPCHGMAVIEVPDAA